MGLTRQINVKVKMTNIINKIISITRHIPEIPMVLILQSEQLVAVHPHDVVSVRSTHTSQNQ